MFFSARSKRSRRVAQQAQASRNLFFESLEQRALLTAGILIGDALADAVLEFDATGSFVGTFTGGTVIDTPADLDFGPDGDLYVTNQAGNVLRFDGDSGSFLNTFIPNTITVEPTYGTFGPDSNFYIPRTFDPAIDGGVLRFDGTTGDLTDEFVASGPTNGGVQQAKTLIFRSDGFAYQLFQQHDGTAGVVRYDGTTGAFHDQFVTLSGFPGANAMIFGPDDNIYIQSGIPSVIRRFDGSTGAFIDNFLTLTSQSRDIAFGSDGDLYVLFLDRVERYDGASAAFVETVVNSGEGGLSFGIRLAFTEQAVTEVEIDVKPDSASNPINLNNNGQIAVAILSTSEFDATQVDPSTVVFAGASAVQYAQEDVDNDGDLDMILHFNTQDTNLLDVYQQLLIDDLDEDGVLDSTNQEADVSLTGETRTDELFQGIDSVNLFLRGQNLRNFLDDLFDF